MSEITVYAKRKTTKEGKNFYIYVSKLIKKDGTETPVSVKFRDECGRPDPEKCPCNITVAKKDCNLSTENYEVEGEPRQSHKLWVSAWGYGSEYVDTSLDDFDI